MIEDHLLDLSQPYLISGQRRFAKPLLPADRRTDTKRLCQGLTFATPDPEYLSVTISPNVTSCRSPLVSQCSSA